MKKKEEWKYTNHIIVDCDSNGVIQAIALSPNITPKPKTLDEIIKIYVKDKVECFRHVYNISKKNWEKHGVITKEIQHLDYFSYRLYYKTLFKECNIEIKFSYNIYKSIV